jgi:hypothetical protein
VRRKRRVLDIDNTEIIILCSHHYLSKMPSFKERFRPSRKYKKNKEAGAATTDEPGTSATAGGTPTTVDDRTGSAALSSYYSVDYCK